jgi:hypothetical protein
LQNSANRNFTTAETNMACKKQSIMTNKQTSEQRMMIYTSLSMQVVNSKATSRREVSAKFQRIDQSPKTQPHSALLSLTQPDSDHQQS